MTTTQETPATSPIGRPTVRVDGPLKVTGVAQYTSDLHFPGLLYALPVEATIANGRVLKLDITAAEKMPSVRAIFHRENIGKIFRAAPELGFGGVCEERRPPFEDDVVRYYGQYIALAVADTFEAAKAAADAVRATYSKDKPNVETHLEAEDDPDVVLTTYGPALVYKANAATPKLRSPARRSSWTRPTSPRLKRTIPLSYTQPPQFGKAQI